MKVFLLKRSFQHDVVSASDRLCSGHDARKLIVLFIVLSMVGIAAAQVSEVIASEGTTVSPTVYVKGISNCAQHDGSAMNSSSNSAETTNATPSAENASRLAKDGNTTVVTMEIVSHSGAWSGRLKVLEVLANGETMVISPNGLPLRYEVRLGRSELLELLSEIIDHDRFFEIDGSSLASAVGSLSDDATTTEIRVRADGRDHIVTLEALPDAATIKPHIEPLQRLATVYNRLMHWIHVVVGGGDDGIIDALDHANNTLEQQYPNAAPLTAGDLISSTPMPDGTLRLSFLRLSIPDFTSPNAPTKRLYVEVDRSPERSTQVRIWQHPS